MQAGNGSDNCTIVPTTERSCNFSIAPYAPAELPGMVDLWVKAWAVAMPEIDFEARRGWLHAHLAQLQARGADILLANDARTGQLAGFTTIERATHWLDQLVVSRTYQGSGAAGALLGAARSVSPRMIRLDVNTENTRARRFYTREGFIETGHGHNPLSGRETVRMEWRATTADSP